MSNVISLAIDLAKNRFQLHGTDSKGKAILKKKVSKEKLLEFVVGLKPCNIYMEAYGTANYWGRQFKRYGHKVKLINPRYVTPLKPVISGGYKKTVMPIRKQSADFI